ncbi:MAG: hydantoinase B/oxoprolinase family protein [Planctomycetota bacterium]
MREAAWQFFIDVGGTFTDIVARRPDGELVTYKLLSSGVIRGQCGEGSTTDCIIDSRRIGEPDDLWVGYRVTVLDVVHQSRERKRPVSSSTNVARFDPRTGRLHVDPFLEVPPSVAMSYELESDEEAPVVAIRLLMDLKLTDTIGEIDVRLGTTRATNALLERKGANVAFITTKGFGDILKIGYQDRPSLFELNIRKREELAQSVIEIDERLSAGGEVLRTPDARVVRRQLEEAKASGVEAVAICFLHSHVNPIHEELVAGIAESVGFSHVSVSSRLMRLERIVPRGDTTVVDAYLSGVTRSYVASLRRSMPQARIRLMTSSGGLIDAALASGKDTILSGPAGGAVGCAHVTYAAGFDRAIGFDMGGTSTDVCRIEPPPDSFEYQHETVKAGVRIMAPMIAVETVAAGGGSICAFDGQKLTVGPHSAGADPGPACYGRGGPLTITDMNLALGRIVADHFPFRLDREIVQRRLAGLCAEVNAATGSSLSPFELADGFIKIANANMAAAIKRISLAKGYDPAHYVLTTFGGAGAQHACALARTLGITRILCSPFAGVLSALGLGVADVKRIGQRSVHVRLDAESTRVLEPVFQAIAEELRRSLIEEEIASAATGPAARAMDVCYVGQASLITVPAAPSDQTRERFEHLHRQLYGYCHEGRDIDIRVVRVELTARSERESPRGLRPATRGRDRTAPADWVEHEMVVKGIRRPVRLYLRGRLSPGDRLLGPAIVIEDTSTIVVDPGWEATVTDAGDILLTDAATATDDEVVSARVDPIRLELFHNQFAAVAEQMGATLRRTALSVNVKERLDFSCAVFTPGGDLVANAPHIPVHLGGMSDCIKALMQDVAAFEPGDVYITNDPFRGGSHLNDVTVITPTHDDRGERILFFVASRAHHAEIGGTRPGSMPPDSTCLAHEGVLIRAFRWIVDGKPQQERLRALLTAPPYPSRTPDENLADIAAQVAANQRGVHGLMEMVARYGVDVVHGYMHHIQDAAERKMRSAIRKLPEGVHRFEDRLDDGSAIRLAVAVEGDCATLDFTGTGPVLKGNLNANRAIVTSAVLYCLRCLIDEDIPLNSGVLAPITVILPECFLNPRGSPDPLQCPAVVGGNVETSQRVVDCIFGALGTVAAGQGTMNNVLMGNERFGYYETICGGAGAGPGFDGADAVHTHMTNTRLTDPEVLESRYPVRLVRFAIRRGSGGAGRYRGGCGVIREIEFLEPLEVSIISQRRTTAPYGLHGGGDGQRGRNILRRVGTDADVELPPIVSISVHAGDRLTIETPGGGAWGKVKFEARSAKCERDLLNFEL